MSTARKVVKITALLAALYGIINVIMGVVLVVSATQIVAADEVKFAGYALAAVAIVRGLILVLIGWLGIKGANRPSKIGPFRVLAIIYFVISVLALATSIAGMAGAMGPDATASVTTGTIIQNVVVLIVSGAAAYFSGQVKKENLERLS